VRDDTPYHERPPREIAQEAACMAKIFAKAKPVDVIYEAFGGIGATAEVLRRRFPKAQMWAFDIDAQCCQMYNRAGDGRMWCAQMDALAGFEKLHLSGNFGAVLDFNRFTLLDFARPAGRWKRHLIQAVLAREPRWFEITDSAVCYLSTNWRRYSLAENSLQAYVDKFKVEIQKQWGYTLRDYAAHRAATYMLFEA
jgi:hypothetical protein